MTNGSSDRLDRIEQSLERSTQILERVLQIQERQQDQIEILINAATRHDTPNRSPRCLN